MTCPGTCTELTWCEECDRNCVNCGGSMYKNDTYMECSDYDQYMDGGNEQYCTPSETKRTKPVTAQVKKPDDLNIRLKHLQEENERLTILLKQADILLERAYKQLKNRQEEVTR